MIGSLLDQRYELEGVITDSPVFTCFAAKDKVLGRDVAVRVVKPPFNGSPGLAEELRRSVAKYSAIRSPQIEAITDVGADGDNLFLVGEITRSQTLADRIKKLAPFSASVSVGLAISICQALEPIHSYGLAHGDLIPQNIVVLANGEVKLQLTGMWEAYSASSNLGGTLLPQMAPYLSPEISVGALPKPSSDVYAVGIILYELLTGRQPYYGDTASSVAKQHAAEALPNAREINPSVPPVLDEIVKKAMAKTPEQRYSNASQMLSDLRKLMDAMRFGRTLTWPITPVAAAQPTASGKRKAAPKAAAPQPVAPRMSAIRPDEEYERPVRKVKKERDVPLWMTLTIVFLAVVFVSLVGVWMLVNVNHPQLVPVPNVVGLSEQEARAVLASSQLEMNVRSRPVSDTVELGHIISVNPSKDEKVRQGGRVSVEVSSGSRMVEMPDLSGMTVDKAKSVLGSLNLEENSMVRNEQDDSKKPGVVTRTEPSAKEKIERQSRVIIFVNEGEAPAPSGDESYLYTLNINLENLHKSTVVKVDVTDQNGTRTIHERRHKRGDRFPVNVIAYGPEATFDIYYDDKLVKTETRKAADAVKQPSGTSDDTSTTDNSSETDATDATSGNGDGE